MKKGVALLLTLTATAFVAASAQAGHKTAAAGVSCKSTLKIAFVTPLTGGAGSPPNLNVSRAGVRGR